jgi:hypothetical protein
VTRLLGWLGNIGADPDDDVDTRTRKALLVHLAVLILPISLVWGVLYLALGAPSGVVAFAYLVVSVVSIGLFARTRNFELLLRMQLLNITLAPTLSKFPTGGFLSSGAVGLWGILGPLGALVFSSVGAMGRASVVSTIVVVGTCVRKEPRWKRMPKFRLPAR